MINAKVPQICADNKPIKKMELSSKNTQSKKRMNIEQMNVNKWDQ